MAYVQCKPGLEVVLRLDIIQDRDIQILSVSYPGNPTITIINLYNDKNCQNNRATKLIRRLPLISNQLLSQGTGTCIIYFGQIKIKFNMSRKLLKWWNSLSNKVLNSLTYQAKQHILVTQEMGIH